MTHWLRSLAATWMLLLMLLMLAPAAADDVTGGQNWWEVPYPDRFDAATLTRAQPAVTIAGKDFVTADGNVIVFRGVNTGDPAKLAAQGRWSEALFEEIHRWGANCVRLPVHPAPWRDKGTDWYFARIDEAVRWANARGMYLVLDWHSIGNLDRELFQHPMYETTRVETMNFWRGIAHRYRGVPTLAMYELFNEPTDNYIGAGAGSLGKSNWDEWRATLEDLIDLVRVYDPAALPLVGGFNWAYDLGEVSDKPIRRERVAYAVHVYPQKALPDEPGKEAQFALWQSQWGHLADTYPLVASEIGWVREDGYNPHVPVIDNTGGYGPMLVQFLEERGMPWMVWNFDPDWAPTMIADWDFTPTEQGRFFRYVMQHLRDGALPLSVLPAPRLTEYPWMSMDRWRAMHAEDVAVAERGGADLLFLGDSITEGWPDFAWTDAFADAPANFGIGGDRTENLLWRLRNGARGALQPEVVVVMIGVNNFGLRGDSAQEVHAGVEAVIEETKAAFGEARIVLLGILPYGEGGPETSDRQRVDEANRLLAGLADDPRVEFHDLGAAFLQPDGTIPVEVMADYLHPTERGYEVFAAQLRPILEPLFR